MKKHEKSAIFDFILITILLIFIGYIVFMKMDNSVYRIRDGRSLEEFSGSWYTTDDKEISLEDVGKIATKNSKGEFEIYIHHTIPAYLISDTFLNLRSKNLRFQVVINDDVIYSFMPDAKQLLSKGNGSSFHRIYISRESAGREIGMRLFPMYNDRGSRINNIYLGRVWDYFGKILDQSFFGFQFSIMTALIGLMLIIISFMSKLESGHNERNRVLGILTLCVGMWATSETLLPQFLFGYSSKLNEINHLLLVFMPYFFISYLYQDLAYSRDILIKISFGVTAAELVAITGMSVVGIMDAHESIHIIHVCFGIILLISVIAIIENISYCKKNNIKYKMLTIILSISVLVLSVVWDLLTYYLDYDGREIGSIMRLGILIGVLILVGDSLKKLFEGIKSVELTEKVAEISYVDSLTGFANRSAFELKKKEIQNKADSGEFKEILVGRFDINDLRKLNDNYGNNYGDRHIIKCAEIINNAFGNSGFTFRIDGDEFAVFIIGDGSEYIYERGILKLKELEREYNRTSDLIMPLCIAYGYAVYDREHFDSLEKAEMEADKRMHEFKNRMKKGAIV